MSDSMQNTWNRKSINKYKIGPVDFIFLSGRYLMNFNFWVTEVQYQMSSEWWWLTNEPFLIPCITNLDINRILERRLC